MRRAKYGNRKTVVDGLKFDSKREAARWAELVLLDRAGEIRELVRQQSFSLMCDGKPLKIRSKGYPNGRSVRYVADFTYFDVRRQKRVIEDSKGARTDVYKLKRAIMEANGYTIVET